MITAAQLAAADPNHAIVGSYTDRQGRLRHLTVGRDGTGYFTRGRRFATRGGAVRYLKRLHADCVLIQITWHE